MLYIEYIAFERNLVLLVLLDNPPTLPHLSSHSQAGGGVVGGPVYRVVEPVGGGVVGPVGGGVVGGPVYVVVEGGSVLGPVNGVVGPLGGGGVVGGPVYGVVGGTVYRGVGPVGGVVGGPV